MGDISRSNRVAEVLLIGVMPFLYGAATRLPFIYFVIHLDQHFQLDMLRIGFCVAMYQGSRVVTSALATKLVRVSHLMGTAIGLAGFLTVFVSDNDKLVPFVVGTAVVGFSETMSSMQKYAKEMFQEEADPEMRNTKLKYQYASVMIGVVFGFLIGGFVYQYYFINGVALFGAIIEALGLCALVLFLVLFSKKQEVKMEAAVELRSTTSHGSVVGSNNKTMKRVKDSTGAAKEGADPVNESTSKNDEESCEKSSKNDEIEAADDLDAPNIEDARHHLESNSTSDEEHAFYDSKTEQESDSLDEVDSFDGFIGYIVSPSSDEIAAGSNNDTMQRLKESICAAEEGTDPANEDISENGEETSDQTPENEEESSRKPPRRRSSFGEKTNDFISGLANENDEEKPPKRPSFVRKLSGLIDHADENHTTDESLPITWVNWIMCISFGIEALTIGYNLSIGPIFMVEEFNMQTGIIGIMFAVGAALGSVLAIGVTCTSFGKQALNKIAASPFDICFAMAGIGTGVLVAALPSFPVHVCGVILLMCFNDLGATLMTELQASMTTTSNYSLVGPLGQVVRRSLNVITALTGPVLFGVYPRLPYFVAGGITLIWTVVLFVVFKRRMKDTVERISQKTGRDPMEVSQRFNFARSETMRALMKKIREEDAPATAAAASASAMEKENISTSKLQTEGESMRALMKR